MTEVVHDTILANGLLTAFVVVGGTMLVSSWVSARCTRGRVHGSAIAILIGLVAAAVAGGPRGVADLPLLSGVGLLGGAMLFGGEEHPVGRSFIERVRAEVKRRTFPLLAAKTPIRFASLGGDAGSIGAAGLARLEHRRGKA